jgi:hypothetical protein
MDIVASRQSHQESSSSAIGEIKRNNRKVLRKISARTAYEGKAPLNIHAKIN